MMLFLKSYETPLIRLFVNTDEKKWMFSRKAGQFIRLFLIIKSRSVCCM